MSACVDHAVVDEQNTACRMSLPMKIYLLAVICCLLWSLIYVTVRTSASAACFLAVCVVMIGGLGAYAAFVLRTSKNSACLILGSRIHTLLGMACVAVCAAVLIEALTIHGTIGATLFALSSWSKKRLLVYFVFAFGACLFLQRAIQLQSERETSLLEAHDEAPFIVRYGLWSLTPLLVLVLLAGAIAMGMLHWCAEDWLRRLAYLLFCVVVAICFLLLIRKQIHERVEYVALILIVCLGCFLCFAVPPFTQQSWDDGNHFDTAVGLSTLGNTVTTQGHLTINEKLYPEEPDYAYSIEEYIDVMNAQYDDARAGRVQALDHNGFVRPILGDSLAGINVFGRLPMAMGIWIGSALGVTLSTVFILGRLTNLLFYALLISNAVRIIPSRKILVAVLGMLPTAVFLAASYSYDPWVTGWTALGVAEAMREFHRRDALLTPVDVARCIVPILLGLLCKAIYFPVLGIMFLMPGTRFSSPGRRRLYQFAVVLSGIAVVFLLLFPMVYGSAVQEGAQSLGDSRGGGGVSVVGQMRYILANPSAFLGMLLSYLATSCFSPIEFGHSTVMYAYLTTNATIKVFGSSNWPIVQDQVLAVLGMPAFLFVATTVVFDQGENSRLPLSGFGRIWAIVCSLAALALSVVALYLSFTNVGEPTVNGWQHRYMLPLLIPGLIVLEPHWSGFRRTVGWIGLGGMVALTIVCDIFYVISIGM